MNDSSEADSIKANLARMTRARLQAFYPVWPKPKGQAPIPKADIWDSYKLSDEDLARLNTQSMLRDSVTREILGRLAKGQIVTLKVGDQPIATYHPDGTVEHHGP